MREAGEKTAVRVGYLLRINSYLDIAILSMWTSNPRADTMIGMAEASMRGPGPGSSEEDLLKKMRPLVAEGRKYYAQNNFPAAMARMRVAHDLIGLAIIRLAEG